MGKVGGRNFGEFMIIRQIRQRCPPYGIQIANIKQVTLPETTLPAISVQTQDVHVRCRKMVYALIG